ncbi:MAG: RNA polymerase sigma factor [Acidobacteriota bacterium]
MDGAELRSELEKHHRESYGWALSCCHRNPAEAENILQTAYLKVLDGKARFQGKSSFKTWLFSVIRLTAIDHRRRELLGRLRLVRHEETQVRVGSSFEDAVYRSELQTMFQQAIGALPRRQQEVLQLVFYHDLSLAEAAEIMGVGLGSARTHYDRGKKQLRQSMAGSGIGNESEIGRRDHQALVP